jgi:hypothetical protein
MPITKNLNGELVFTPKVDKYRSDNYGVHSTEEFQLADKLDQLKQLSFDLSTMAASSRVKFVLQNPTPDSDVVITFPNSNTTLGAGGGGGFSIIQCDSGTSPTSSLTDLTLTLTSANNRLSISGDATTDTVTLTVNEANIVHANLSGLASDDHTQYALLAATRGLQTFAGAIAITGDSTLNGNVIFGGTVNSSLTGANARIPSHTASRITFTNASLTSIASANNGGVTDGHTLQIINETGANITIVNNYASATAGEKIYTGSSADQILANHGEVWLQYNSTSNAWVATAPAITNLATSAVTGILPISNGGTGNTTGTAAISTTSTITAVSTNASYYLPMVSAATGNLGLGSNAGITFNPSTQILSLKPVGANQDALRITNSAATRTWAWGPTAASDVGFYFAQGATTYDVWYQGWHSFGLTGTTPVITWDFNGTATSTAPTTDIVRNSGTYNLPVVLSRNLSTTVNTYSGFAMAGGSSGNNFISCQLLAIHTNNTSGSEASNFNLNLRNGASIATQLAITAAGAFTIGATGSTNTHSLNTATSTVGSGALTLSNGPSGKSGNPAGYISININGSARVIPYW